MIYSKSPHETLKTHHQALYNVDNKCNTCLILHKLQANDNKCFVTKDFFFWVGDKNCVEQSEACNAPKIVPDNELNKTWWGGEVVCLVSHNPQPWNSPMHWSLAISSTNGFVMKILLCFMTNTLCYKNYFAHLWLSLECTILS